MRRTVAGVSASISTPTMVAVTMNGSDVAWSIPATNALRAPTSGRYTTAGIPRTTTRATRKIGTSASVEESLRRASRSKVTPLVTKNTGTRKP
jgi:hypothetical protein